MEEILSHCSVNEVVEIMPSFCFYYNELLFCQSFQVRLEVNKRNFHSIVINTSFGSSWYYSRYGSGKVC